MVDEGGFTECLRLSTPRATFSDGIVGVTSGHLLFLEGTCLSKVSESKEVVCRFVVV